VPSFPQVAAVPAVQAFSGSVLTGTLVQVPWVPARPHEAQVPEQADAQQKFCWQKPDAHWAVVVHAVPIPCSEQVVPLQTLGGVQSVEAVAAVQVFLQILLVVSQAKLPQEVGAAGVQVPVPLQTEAGV
jgi:hypothetical protein